MPGCGGNAMLASHLLPAHEALAMRSLVLYGVRPDYFISHEMKNSWLSQRPGSVGFGKQGAGQQELDESVSSEVFSAVPLGVRLCLETFNSPTMAVLGRGSQADLRSGLGATVILAASEELPSLPRTGSDKTLGKWRLKCGHAQLTGLTPMSPHWEWAAEMLGGISGGDRAPLASPWHLSLAACHGASRPGIGLFSPSMKRERAQRLQDHSKGNLRGVLSIWSLAQCQNSCWSQGAVRIPESFRLQ